MSELLATCYAHPDRGAIGVCVVTGRPLCAECSTQYRGVNYSKEGLETLLAQERAGAGSRSSVGVAALIAGGVLAPLAVFAVALWVNLLGMLTIDIIQGLRGL